jgi:calcium-dependent protein kinase
LEFDEIKKVIEKSGQNLDSSAIDQIISEIDFAGNKKINYSEFLAATIEAEKFLTEDKLMAIFNAFDVDKTGFITAKNIKDAFSKFGKKISDKDIQVIMDQHDIDGGKSIDFDEFKQMMMGK